LTVSQISNFGSSQICSSLTQKPCACILLAPCLSPKWVYSQCKLHWAHSFKLLTSIFAKIPCQLFLVYSNADVIKQTSSENVSAVTHQLTLHFTPQPYMWRAVLHFHLQSIKKTECLMSKNDGGRLHSNQILTRGSLTFSLKVFSLSLFNSFYKRLRFSFTVNIECEIIFS